MKHRIDPTLAESLTRAVSPVQRADVLFDYMKRRGQTNYDESVTQIEHSLQCAYLARQAGASGESVGAALLHDIGHFLTDEHADNGDFLAEDWRHEAVGADCLAPFVVESVIQAIRLHVPAKRFLCATDPAYFDGLSRASQRSLEVQGGKMSPEEEAAFRENRWHELAVRVRRWDDGAKVAAWEVPSLESYRSELEACLLAR
jgi:phosphonate degradation associated HDIG domain protein